MFVYHLFLPVFYVCMYVYILSYFVNKLEIWWLYLSPIGKDKQHEALANTWKLKGNQEWKKVYVDPDRTPEQRKEHNKLLEEMRARRNNGEQVFLAQGKIKVRRQHFAREDNGAANVTSKVKDNGSNKVSENHKEDVAQRSGADTKHETNQLDDQQAEDKQPVADAQQQNVVLDNNTLHATRV